MGKIVLLMGKSSTGKDTIYKNLMTDEKLGLTKIILYSTRPMRQGETDGIQYFFTNEDKYEEMKRNGKIIEERTYQTNYGPWRYFTADDGQINIEDAKIYLMIGTLESYSSLCAYYGAENIIPVLIESDDRIRMERAMKREAKQENPKYDELCRRFLSDEEDFSKDKIDALGISETIMNNGTKEECLDAVKSFIEVKGGN